MVYDTKILLSLLEKFAKVAKISEKSTSVDNIIWTSIIFNSITNTVYYNGWRFVLEVPFPVEQSFIVNYQAFYNVVKLASSKEIEIEVQKKSILLQGKGFKQRLKQFNIDLKPIIIPTTTTEPVPPSFVEGLSLCSIASSSIKIDPFRYGVILSDEGFLLATEHATNSVGFYNLKECIVPEPILIQLHWCEVLPLIGNIKTVSLFVEDVESKFATIQFYIENPFSEKDIRLVFPVIRIDKEVIITDYIRSLQKHITLPTIDSTLIKRLEVTTDIAYKVASLFSQDGNLYLSTRSSIKGDTIIKLGKGGDIQQTEIELVLLKKAINLNSPLHIDFDNLSLFTKKDDFIFAFSLISNKER